MVSGSIRRHSAGLDSRPRVREEVASLGDIRKVFDFDQEPLPPMPLPPHG